MSKASLNQGQRILALVDETGWDAEQVNRRIIEQFGMLREIGYLLGEGELTSVALRAWLSTRDAKADSAALRQAAVQQEYRERGFKDLVIPLPMGVSNREYARRQKRGQDLFYRPASNEVSYEAFMQAVGQDKHWTVTDENERAKIGWEPAPTGYWFWAEVAPKCPRVGTSRNDLIKAIRLLTLEEYAIVWHTIKVEMNIILDQSTWTWLRTSYDASGALEANGYDGRVYVNRHGAGYLAYAYSGAGGRLAEVVKG